MPRPQLINDTEVAGLLKRLYDDLEVDYFPNAHVTLSELEKAGPGGLYNMRWGSDGVRFNIITGTPVGGTSSPSGYLPPDAKRTEVQGVIDVQRVYVRRQLDYKLILGTQSKKAAYQTIGNRVVAEAKGAFKRAMQFYVHGNATGVRAVVTATSSTTNATVNSLYGITSAGQGGAHLGLGMYVAVRDATGATMRGKAYISAISQTAGSDNCVLTLDTAVTGLTATDIIVAATASDDEYGNVINGLANITNRGGSYATLHGISATDSLPTRMTTTDLEAADTISEMDLWELIARVAGKSGQDARSQGGEFLVITTPGLQKKLAQSFFGQRNWAMQGKVTLKGGFVGVEVCGVPVIADAYCPAGTCYLLHKPSLAWVNAADFQGVDFNDAALWRWIADRDAYETSWRWMGNLGAPARNAHGSIIGITDANRYTHLGS